MEKTMQREQADVALAGGNVDEAVRLYSDILVVSVSNKNDDTETQAEDMDACMAMEVLGGDDHPHEDGKGSKDCGLMAKVYHRKAQALIGRGDKVQGLNVYRDGLKQCGGENLRAAILLVLQNQMPDSWITEYWMDKVSRCEVAHPLSARDGILLKRVPASRKMVREEMTRSMLALLESDAVFSWECRELMVSLWENAGSLRQSCAYVRGAVYAQAGKYEQGERMRLCGSGIWRWSGGVCIEITLL
eukprot:jgi/Picre1/30491/NNA_005855.t1